MPDFDSRFGGGDRSHWSVDASTMAVTIFTVNAFIFLHMYDLV